MKTSKTLKSRQIIGLLSKHAPNGLLDIETASKAKDDFKFFFRGKF